MPSISFFQESIKVKFPEKNKTKQWIKIVIQEKKKDLGEINIIFCDDDYLMKLNNEYLNHDTYTDIITFDFVEGDKINGDIFISWQQTAENAKVFHVEHLDELHRVIIHGILHLLGYKDKTEAEQKQMRREENKALAQLKTI